MSTDRLFIILKIKGMIPIGLLFNIYMAIIENKMDEKIYDTKLKFNKN